MESKDLALAPTFVDGRRSGAATLAFVLVALNFVLAAVTLPVAVGSLLRPMDSRADFVTYYTAGRQARVGEPRRVYDLETQRADQAELVHDARAEPLGYVNPPSSLLVLAPLSALPVDVAYRVMGLVTAASIAAIGLWAARDQRRSAASARPSPALLLGSVLVGAPPFVVAVFQGSLAPIVAVASFFAARAIVRERAGEAAAWMLLVAIKPQFAVAIALVLFARRAWRILAAVVAAQVGAAAVTAALYGPTIWTEWLSVLRTYNSVIDRYGASTSGMWNVRGVVASVLGASHAGVINGIGSAVFLAGLGLLAFGVARSLPRLAPQRRADATRIWLAAILAATVVTNLHTHPHDWLVGLAGVALVWDLVPQRHRLAVAAFPLAAVLTVLVPSLRVVLVALVAAHVVALTRCAAGPREQHCEVSSAVLR